MFRVSQRRLTCCCTRSASTIVARPLTNHNRLPQSKEDRALLTTGFTAVSQRLLSLINKPRLFFFTPLNGSYLLTRCNLSDALTSIHLYQRSMLFVFTHVSRILSSLDPLSFSMTLLFHYLCSLFTYVYLFLNVFSKMSPLTLPSFSV